MREDIRARWVDRLRNGGLEQGRGVLRNLKDEYCCLGVLCEIAVDDGVIPPGYKDISDGYFRYGEQADGGLLPIEIRHWSGIDSANPRVETGSGSYTLSSLNDTEQANFTQIAMWIEGDPEL